MTLTRPTLIVTAVPLLLGTATRECGDVDPTPDPNPVGIETREENTTCIFTHFAEPDSSYTLSRTFPSLSFSQPVFLTHASDGSDRIFVVEKAGVVKVFANTPTASSTVTFMDIRSKVASSSSEMGLLGLAFHPDYELNGYVYVNYTADNPRRTVVARYTRASENSVDVNSQLILLEVTQPYTNHNGGMLTFGPDGYLYIGMGDGGSGGDPLENGQNPNALLASMLRLDVDHPTGGKNYGVPADNPFVAGGGAPEVFAKGLRNPWRFSFDRALGDLWVGDVGQDKYEEVDILKLGGNYGWNTMEGFHCYDPATGCDVTGLDLPVLEYDHSVGKSITGGYVYRGTQLLGLQGRYVYGDYTNGRIWALRYDQEQQAQIDNILLLDSDLAISSFGEDESGELYVVALAGGIYSLNESSADPGTFTFPQKLSETGCFVDTPGRVPAPGVLPYGVNSPLWSDGELKDRWLALPGLDQATFTDTTAWDLPDGTVAIKDFAVETRRGNPLTLQRLETRILLKLDGTWRGYSYQWNEEQTDATLLEGALTQSYTLTDAAGQPYTYTHTFPSRSDCQVCHTVAAGSVLGPRTGQLNGAFEYPSGVTDNQLHTLNHIDFFNREVAGPYDTYARYPDPLNLDESLEGRARSYLAANCAHCHMPGGTAVSTMDLRYETPLSDTRACGVTPSQGDLGVPGALLIDPGSPATSMISIRMATVGEGRMPPLATHVVDTAGLAVVDAWITNLTSCP